MHPLVQRLRAEMLAAADEERAAGARAYLKTEQPFYGIAAKPRREIFRRAVKEVGGPSSYGEYESIIRELWSGEHREDMYQALEVAERFSAYHTPAAWSLYEELVHTASNWDTLDWICAKLVGPLVLEHRELEQDLRRWARSESFWVRRAALLSHLRHRERTNTALLSELILELAPEKEFFIRKAIGWVLRDFSYSNPEWVSSFVEKNREELSGLSRREALKKIERDRARGSR